MKRFSLLVLFILLIPHPAFAAFDGPRVYWPLPKNTNILSTHYILGTANASLTNWSRVQPNIDINSQILMLTYTRVQPVFGRTAYWQFMLPAGTINTSSPLPVAANDTFVNGLADPTLGATFNVYGVPALKAKDFLRYDMDFSINLGLNITAPVGQYDEGEALNVGSNQWKFRLSAPIVKALGPWVPGARTTLELMPAVLLFTPNDNAQDNKVEQDPLYSVEAHLTRDLTQQAFISLDYTWIRGGEETYTDNSSGLVVRKTDGPDAQLIGATLGFEVNDHMLLFITHMQTAFEDGEKVSLEASLTKVTLSWSWHDVLERVQQFRKK